jgi:tRNA threonylcarbamoyladenosine biosynthesis protein TsaE
MVIIIIAAKKDNTGKEYFPGGSCKCDCPFSFFSNMVYSFVMEILTSSSVQTKKLGHLLAEELRGGEIICLTGDLGAGKTTFTQGILKGLKIKGPYTSPTFAIIKHYHVAYSTKHKTKKQLFTDIYHIDAYRISAKDLLELGFKDFAGKENSLTIIEWPEKVKKIIPTAAVWINFAWASEKERKITFKK